MRKKTTVTIDNKKYEIKELTVEEIIQLGQSNKFFGTSNSDNGVEENPKNDSVKDSVEDFDMLKSDIEAIMDASCDFKMSDLRKLAPSEINLLFEAFKEVNSDFFGWLKVLGIAELLDQIRAALLQNFSKMLVT